MLDSHEHAHLQRTLSMHHSGHIESLEYSAKTSTLCTPLMWIPLMLEPTTSAREIDVDFKKHQSRLSWDKPNCPIGSAQ